MRIEAWDGRGGGGGRGNGRVMIHNCVCLVLQQAGDALPGWQGASQAQSFSLFATEQP